MNDVKAERIAKVLARAGLCSRRDAERWILDGRVKVNGKILESPAFTVTPGDDIRVDGKQVQAAEDTRLYMYHKPAGLVTTARDERGRETVFDSLPKELGRVVSVGRLDINSEGLLLLTNDGGLARHLELPATGWKRTYRVRAHGRPDPATLEGLAKGITVEGVKYGAIEAELERQQGANCWMIVSLREGKNREVRKIMEAIGMKVSRLIRVSYGVFQLGSLPEGAIQEVAPKMLREQVGDYFKAQKKK